MTQALMSRDMERVRRVLDAWRGAGLNYRAVKGLLLEIHPDWQNAEVEELLYAVDVEV
jgi:hypothetical protein